MTYKYKKGQRTRHIRKKVSTKMTKMTKNNKTNKHNTNKRKMKGGFSIGSLWDTMTYNLSNAISTFSISPPTAQGNSPSLVNPSVSKHFLQV